MTRHIFIFLGTFVLGAVIALAARTATHKSHSEPASHSSDHSALATRHSALPALPASATKPVNTVCAICGMEVDPNVPTLTYQGKPIGFGCKMCPPKFKAEPDKYGPYYLRNEIIKR